MTISRDQPQAMRALPDVDTSNLTRWPLE